MWRPSAMWATTSRCAWAGRPANPATRPRSRSSSAARPAPAAPPRTEPTLGPAGPSASWSKSHKGSLGPSLGRAHFLTSPLQGAPWQCSRARTRRQTRRMVMGNAELEGSLGLTAYRVLFERAPEGMIFSTLDGQIHAANPAACRMLAMTEAEIRRRGRTALVDDPDDPELEAWLAERARTGMGAGEKRLSRSDGRVVDLAVQSRLFADTDGTVMSFSVFRDITARAKTARTIEE